MKRKDFLRRTAASLVTVSLVSATKAMAEAFPENGRVMPAFFIGHGSPMNAIEDNVFVKGWKAALADVPKPKAILCVSAHWLTQGTLVTAMERPRTIHDFGGFPQELFAVQYPATGQPVLAHVVRDVVTTTPVGLNQDWGLDHGAWSVLKPVFPQADIPVVQVSIDIARDGRWHYALAKELADLRRRGVLVIGSGNMVHNLRMIDFSMNRQGFDWAVEVNDTFKTHILSGDHAPLLDYRSLGKPALMAVPTPDHYYPLLYVLAMQGKNEQAVIFNDQAVLGSLTMTSVRIG